MNKQSLATIVMVGLIGLMVWTVVNGSQKNQRQTQEKQPEVASATESGVVNEGDILYWGTTCPFCHVVLDYIKDNSVDDKLNVVKKEVYEDQVNAAELGTKAETCGMGTNSIGVPLLYTEEKNCLVGSDEIIDYLQNKMNNIQEGGQDE
jgi:glutaredoxin